MTLHPSIQGAIEAIGPAHEDDWRIDPVAHVKELRDAAPKLADALGEAQVASTALQYEKANGAANEAQDDFKSPARWANWLVLMTAFVSASLTVAGTLVETTGEAQANARSLFILLGIAGIVVSALATMFLSRARDGGELGRWFEERARAEQRRLEYFDVVRESGGREDAELELLKLEYFRRFLVESQERYFEKRGEEHRRSAQRYRNWSGAAAALAAAATGSAGLLAMTDRRWTALAGVAVVAAAASAMFVTTEALHQDRRNSRSYRKTLDLLTDVKKQSLDSVREAVLAGSTELHDAFAEAVRSLLIQEHQQWLTGADQHISALDELAEQLRSFRKPEDSPPAA